MIVYILGTLCVLFGIGLFWQQLKYEKIAIQLKLTTKKAQDQAAQMEDSLQAKEALRAEVTALTIDNKHLAHQLSQGEQQTKVMKEQLLLQFKNLSNELLEQKSAKFTQQNKKQIEDILLPLREKLRDFQKQVADTQQVSIKGNMALKQEFEKVNSLYEKMREDSQKTTQAIMGDNKLQGTWGEMHALQILESTGLRKDEQYFVQESFTTAEGKRYVPDIIIKLPGGRNIVMDVKVSLVHYVKFFNANDEAEKAKYLKKHIQSLKNHIKSLHEKNYVQLYGLKQLDFVLLLLPIDPAFYVATKHEPSLFQEAFERNILLVSPATLRAAMPFIAHIWKNNLRNTNALEIARQSGLLYDKFVGFVEDLKKIGYQLKLAEKAYEQAFKKLEDGRGNMITKVEQIKKLGARTTKVLANREN